MIDPKTGRKKIGFLENLRLDELSLVDVPANKKSRVAIFKRGEPGELDAGDLAKSMYGIVETAANVEGPKTFAQLIAANEERRREWEAYEQLMPFFDALTESLRSIAADQNSSTEHKIELVRVSVQDFMNAVAAEMPDVEQELTKLLKANPAIAEFIKAGGAGDNGDDDMKTLEEALARIKVLEGQAQTSAAAIEAAQKSAKEATDQIEPLTKRATDAEAKVKEFETAAEIAKSDETIVVEGQTLVKSKVGEATFNVLKAQAERIELADFTKRAEGAEFGALPGETVAKAKALRAVSKIADKDEREALEAMLKGGNAAMSKRMRAAGRDGEGGGEGGDVGKAAVDLAKLVKAEMDKTPGIGEAVAMDRVIQTNAGAELAEQVEQDRMDAAGRRDAA